MHNKNLRIIAVVLMLAGMGIYLATMDLSEEPEPETGNPVETSQPAGTYD